MPPSACARAGIVGDRDLVLGRTHDTGVHPRGCTDLGLFRLTLATLTYEIALVPHLDGVLGRRAAYALAAIAMAVILYARRSDGSVVPNAAEPASRAEQPSPV
jgi:hypothetical protein